MDAHEIALRRIAEARATGATLLDLGDLHLESLPKELGDLADVRVLNLGKSAPRYEHGNLKWEDEDQRPSNVISQLNAPLEDRQPLDLNWCTQLDFDDFDWCIGLLTSINALKPLAKLQQLDLSGCIALTSIADLSSLVNLQRLYLGGCTGLTSIAGLSSLVNLQRLYLGGCTRLTSIADLSSLVNLQQLDLSGCTGLTSIDALKLLAKLQQLDLSDCTGLTSIAGLSSLVNLQQLDLSDCTGLTALKPLAKLQQLDLNWCTQLDLSGCTGLTSIGGLSSLVNLQRLYLRACTGLTSIADLSSLVNLQWLDLSGCTGLTSIAGLSSLVNLQWLDLSGCTALTALKPLAKLQQLDLNWCTQLDLSGCTGLTSIGGLSSLVNLQRLDLSGCTGLTSIADLSSLVNLQRLDLSGCTGLTSITDLSSLAKLQQLDLSGCTGLTSIAGLSSLAELNWLFLHGCTGLTLFAPLHLLLPRLQHLSLYECPFEDLNRAICGTCPAENVLDDVRAHYAALASGVSDDAELNVFVLGNGGAGRTTLCNVLSGLPFDTHCPSTHGIDIAHLRVRLPGRATPVRLNLWDFGGQEIYHGSHALFLHSPAIFLLLWTPDTEEGEYLQPGGSLRFPHRPLAYWLDYIRARAGADDSVLIIQGKCDNEGDERPLPPVPLDNFSALRCLHFSAHVPGTVTRLRAALKEAATKLLTLHPPPPIGKERVRIRNHLRKLRRRHPTLTLAAFRRLCAKHGLTRYRKELLRFLHRTRVLFRQPEAFQGRIILDQSWALQAIYAVFDPHKVLPALRGDGRFTRALLERLVWQDCSKTDQRLFLGMMEDCGICFRRREIYPGYPEEWEYVAPDLLPGRRLRSPIIQDELAGRPPDAGAPATAQAELRYDFLHDGILRRFLSWLGTHAGGSAVYWKFGCWFYDQERRVGILIESAWDNDLQYPLQGVVSFKVWGEQAAQLLPPLVAQLHRASFAEKPEPVYKGVEPHRVVADTADTPLLVVQGKQNATTAGPTPLSLYLSLQSLPPMLQPKARALIHDPYGLAWLATLCDVRRVGSYSAAARQRRKITPQGVREQMEQLRTHFRRRPDPIEILTVNKGNQGVRLTAEGNLLCDWYERHWHLPK